MTIQDSKIARLVVFLVAVVPALLFVSGTATAAVGQGHSPLFSLDTRHLASFGDSPLFSLNTRDWTGVSDHGELPTAFRVSRIHPNPFNPRTTIHYDLPQDAVVDLALFDVRGRLVRMIRSGSAELAGRHRAIWNGRDDHGRQVASGVYVCRLRKAGSVAAQSLTLVK